MSNRELEHISFLAMVNADRPEKLSEAVAPQKEVSKVSAIVTSGYLEKLVSKRIDEIKSERDVVAAEAAKSRKTAIALAEAELEKKFSNFIQREIASVSDGVLHLEYNGTSYTIALTGGVYVLSGATIRDTKIEGAGGSPEANLVNTLANLSDKASVSVYTQPSTQFSPEQIELDRLRGVIKRYVSALEELKTVSR